MYKRARYYDPGTGDFISRDPLEYVDGMSLYRGYFAPGNVDPTGKTICKCVSQTQIRSTVVSYTGGTTTNFIQVNGPCPASCSAQLTRDESATAALCGGNLICEQSIADLMNTVSNTKTRNGTDGEYCFQFINAAQQGCGCQKGQSTVNLPGGCTVEFLEVFPFKNQLSPASIFSDEPTVVVTGFNMLGVPSNSFSSHGIAKVCCGAAACMFFDIGSENPNGQFGGGDRFFSPDDLSFNSTIDLNGRPVNALPRR